MPRTKKAATEEKKEFVPSHPSEPFFKAFMFEEQTPDMMVDIGGDTFSDTIEGAIRTVFADMPLAKKMKIPNLTPLINDVIVEREPEALLDCMNKVIVIQMRCHEVEEFEAAKSNVGPDNFVLQLNKCPAGYIVALQEYILESCQAWAKGPNEVFHLTHATLNVADPDSASKLFPATVQVEGTVKPE